MLTCEVALRESVRQTDKYYSYKADTDLIATNIRPGQYVLVPFGKGNKSLLAVVIKTQDEQDEKKLRKLKAIDKIVDLRPVLNTDQLQLVEKIANRFSCTRGDAIQLMVPSTVGKRKPESAKYVTLTDTDKTRQVLSENKLRSINQINMLNALLISGKLEQNSLLADTHSNSAQLLALKKKELVQVTSEALVQDEARKIKANSEWDTSKHDEKYSTKNELNDEQLHAVEEICAPRDKASTFLLYGITGSGKTEVYLNVIEKALDKGEGVIYLVPEISLTPQAVSWITGRFGDKAAVLHSKLRNSQRYNEWNRIRSGVARVVVAPRSGIFAPVDNLKLIIIDEEHDGSYKSETFPKYNTKDIALMRAKLNGATIVLGSATPSVESFYAAKLGVYNLLTLTKRANTKAVLPKVVPVDMREQVKLGNGDILSEPLRLAMAKAFSRKEQVMLFLNRRGYSRTLTCLECNGVCTCPSCSVGMTLHNNSHSSERLLVCHYCGYTIPVSEAVCPDCGSKKLTRVGFGTQQLEELLHNLYPHEKLLRMDQDTTSVSGAHEKILEAFGRKEASILLGTQMIAKGLDFPNVTVVGILSADLIVNSSDFRSAERAFQLITQASGRAGRGDNPGTVYIQTYNPDSDMLAYAACQDYESFYNAEITFRQVLALPPFKAVGEVVVSSEDEEVVKQRAGDVSKYLQDFIRYQDEKYCLELYGPMPAVIYELRGRFRLSFTIKAINKASLVAIFERLLTDFDPKYYSISVDLDPSR